MLMTSSSKIMQTLTKTTCVLLQLESRPLIQSKPLKHTHLQPSVIYNDTYVGPSCRWLDSRSWDRGRGVSQSYSRVSWCSSPEGIISNRKLWFWLCHSVHPLTGCEAVKKVKGESHLLFVDGAPGELRQVHELQVESPKLGQDGAPGWGPAPTPTGATAIETTPTKISIAGCCHACNL